MGDRSEVGLTKPTRLSLGLALLAWLVLALALPLAALTLNAFKLAGFPLGFWVAAQGSLIGLAALALVATRRTTDGNEAAVSAAQISTEAIGGAAFVGFAGVIAANGFDGLAFPLGIAAGLALLAILIAPRLDTYQTSSVGSYFAARFGSVWPKRLVITITAIGSVLLIAANLRAGGRAVQGLLATSFPVGIVATGVGMFALSILARLTGSGVMRWRSRIVFGLMLIAFVAPLVWLTLHQGRMPIPHIAYGAAIFDVAASEQKLLSSRLADFKSLKPLAAPFLSLSMWNFAGIVLSIALGLAALPWFTPRDAVNGQTAQPAARSVANATALSVVFLAGIAAIAVLLRAAVADLIGTGVKTAELPDAVLQSLRLSWVNVCDSYSDRANIPEICAKLSGQKGLVRLQDLAFDSDSYLFSASLIAGVPGLVWKALLAGGLLAALISGAAILGAAVGRADPEGRSPNLTRYTLVGLIFAGSTAVATLAPADIPTLFSEGLLLIASGIFPALVLGLFWARMGSPGAVAAMLSGFTVAGLYLVGVRLFPVAMFEWTGAVSNAAPSAVRKLAALKAVFDAATEESAQDAAWAALARHAQTVSNWWGLKPAAFVLIAAPLSFAAGVVATLLTARSAPGR